MKFKTILALLAVIIGAIGMYVYWPKETFVTTQYQIVPLNGGTFDLDVTVLITEDTAFALNYVKKNLDTTALSNDFNSRGTTFTSVNSENTIIWLPNTNDKAVIMHELLHATIDIMRRVGLPLNDDTEESYTYELQYLTNQFFKQVN